MPAAILLRSRVRRPSYVGVRIRFVSVLSAEKFLYAGTAFFFPVFTSCISAVGCGQIAVRKKDAIFLQKYFVCPEFVVPLHPQTGTASRGWVSGCAKADLPKERGLAPRGRETEDRLEGGDKERSERRGGSGERLERKGSENDMIMRK